MFGIVSPLHTNVSRNVVKTILRHRRSIAAKKKVNPGVNLQMKLFNDKQKAELDTLDVDELESDFMNIGLSHKQHIEQINTLKEQEKYLIVRQKYFKEKFPNFLTWSDKQQMRYLHNTNPEEWTIEKLSEGFPALPETVAKIIKSTWTKKNINKIKNHDASVQSNWELFKEGKLDLSPHLKEHLSKFTNRKLNFDMFEVEEEQSLAKNVEGEFSEIIKSYECIKNKGHNNQNIKEIKTKKVTQETYITEPPEKYKDKSNTTLKHLQEKLQSEIQLGKEISEEDKFLLKELTSQSTKLNNQIVDLTYTKKEVTALSKKEKNYNHLKYPEKIVIPKEKLKRGSTYRLNDCFYDSDGLFLYRVPGLYK